MSCTESLSKKDLQEIFESIVEWIEKHNCKVYLNDTKTVFGSNGYFTPDPEPHIKVGMKGRSLENAIVLILHEFCHFWQWEENFLNRIDDRGNEIYGNVLSGKEVTEDERNRARKLVALSEYDCEQRTAHLLKKWNLESVRSVQEHIKAANAYNRHVAWSIGTGDSPGSGKFFPGHEGLADKLWPSKTKFRWFTAEEACAPISEDAKQIFDEAYAKYAKHAKNSKA